MKTEILPAMLDDAAAIFDLQKCAYQTEAELYNDFSIPPLTETLDELRNKFRSIQFFKVVEDGRIVGAIRAYVKDATCLVGRLIVHSDCRRRGIGSALLMHVEAVFPKIRRFELFTGHKSVNNIRLYERFGYREFRRETANEKLTVIFMEKVTMHYDSDELVLERAEARRKTALAILDDLRLTQKWSRFGRPILVGALSFDLAVAPDIDMEIYCSELKMEDGFQILLECARNPRVISVQFLNGLNTPDKALYWQLHYKDEDGVEWKIDMWSAPNDYDLPRGENFVEPIKKALTRETRLAILSLKEARAAGKVPMFLSVDLYRAVIDGGVRTIDQWQEWQKNNTTGILTDWKPMRKSGQKRTVPSGDKFG